MSTTSYKFLTTSQKLELSHENSPNLPSESLTVRRRRHRTQGTGKAGLESDTVGGKELWRPPALMRVHTLPKPLPELHTLGARGPGQTQWALEGQRPLTFRAAAAAEVGAFAAFLTECVSQITSSARK